MSHLCDTETVIYFSCSFSFPLIYKIDNVGKISLAKKLPPVVI